MITRADRRRKGAEEKGIGVGTEAVGGSGGGHYDVPTQGYLILTVRGERFFRSVWILADQSSGSDPGQITHSLLLSGHAHTRGRAHAHTSALGWTGEDAVVNEAVMNGS